MGEIIVWPDGYFCFPRHNFNWNTPALLAFFRRAQIRGIEAKEVGRNLMRRQRPLPEKI